ncbi:metallophosphoesterase [Archaeoglobus neptunius]|uniref:metallophosphoesterase n=1 Tax=Archaeoglobus neptunius TaxID=2798580 RepID=UPI0019275376|nr:metallophosphoesterase [Archaeoglobus neptunius]
MEIVHISDVHFGSELIRGKIEEAVRQINAMEPDLVILTGDIGMWGIHHEFREAYETLSNLKPELFAVPGNHDARNDGIKYFKLYFGRNRKVLKFDDFVFVGVDSTLPDSDDGYIGPEQRQWITEKVRGSCINFITLHHHVVPVPHTGRNMNVLIDAAEFVETLTLNCHGAIVLAGHRHVPYSTKLLRTHIIHAGSVSSYKVLMPDNNYNILKVGGGRIDLKLRFVDLGEVEIGSFQLKPVTPESMLRYHRLTSTRKVLLLSRRNDCRSKIAEALFNKLSPGNMHAVSAGLEPSASLNPMVSRILGELGLSVTKPKKFVEEMAKDADYVVSFDEDITADEIWKVKRPNNEDECRKLVKMLEENIRDLVWRILL